MPRRPARTIRAAWVMRAAEAQATAGRLFGVSQLAMLMFTPIMGIMVDRFDRVTALAIAMAIATVGYLALGLVGDPFTSRWMILCAILGGAGEACVVVSGPALVGQEAPARIRGSIIGMVGMFGAVGVLVHSKIAGMLFDAWIICVAAIAVRVVYGPSKGAVHDQLVADAEAKAGAGSRPVLATDESG